jgi:Fe-S cluster biogenesis protein NfuA
MSNIEERIKKSLENIRPNLQADGGDVQFVEFDQDSGVAKLQLMGACAGCPMAQVTLKDGVEAVLTKEVPEVKKVEAV